MRTSTRRVSILFLTLALAASRAAMAAGTAQNADSRERQTMEKLRSLAGALLSRQIDETSGENRLGDPAGDWVLTGQASTLVRMPPRKELRSYSSVFDLLRPREDFIYLCDIPERDAWGERIEVYYEQEKLLSGKVVTVRSSGANRHFDSDVYETGGFIPGAAIDDIVIFDRQFVRWPLGVPDLELRVEPTIGRCPGYDDGAGSPSPVPP